MCDRIPVGLFAKSIAAADFDQFFPFQNHQRFVDHVVKRQARFVAMACAVIWLLR